MKWDDLWVYLLLAGVWTTAVLCVAGVMWLQANVSLTEVLSSIKSKVTGQ
jgi:hypothetical protein